MRPTPDARRRVRRTARARVAHGAVRAQDAPDRFTVYWHVVCVCEEEGRGAALHGVATDILGHTLTWQDGTHVRPSLVVALHYREAARCVPTALVHYSIGKSRAKEASVAGTLHAESAGAVHRQLTGLARGLRM